MQKKGDAQMIPIEKRWHGIIRTYHKVHLITPYHVWNALRAFKPSPVLQLPSPIAFAEVASLTSTSRLLPFSSTVHGPSRTSSAHPRQVGSLRLGP